MSTNGKPTGTVIRVRAIVITLIALALMIYVGARRLSFETNLLPSLPQNDPAMADAHYVLEHYPILDQVAVDLGLEGGEPDRELLVRAAARLEEGMEQSGLFQTVGSARLFTAFASYHQTVIGNLPAFFSREELETRVAPLLARDRIDSALAENLALLGGLEGTGQAEVISRDPLGLRFLVLERLGRFLPESNATLYRQRPFSADGRHVLVTGRLAGSGLDARVALRVNELMSSLAVKIPAEFPPAGGRLQVTPVGSFRASVENESYVKSDTARAILISTLGIALLLLLAFPRPLLGLASLIPAFMGTAAALFLLAVFFGKVSLIAVGFGGAIISLTVDYGIAYMLFLDRPRASSGREASREIWFPGLFGCLTTIGAFLALYLIDFKVLKELGLFASLGVAFSFIFVVAVFPRIFQSLRPARRRAFIPLDKIGNFMVTSGGWPMFYLLIGLMIVLFFFARPNFTTDLESLNTVSPETVAAENLVKKIWGDLSARIYILTEGDSAAGLQRNADAVSAGLAPLQAQNAIASFANLSGLFPGREMAEKNLAAWRAFWTGPRTRQLARDLRVSAAARGFTPDAFSGFLKTVGDPDPGPVAVPAEMFGLLGISPNRGSGRLMFLASVTPGPAYDPKSLFGVLHRLPSSRMLDPRWFTRSLSEYLGASWAKMFLLLGIGLLVILFFHLLDLRLILIALLPTAFAFICTLATLNLLHYPLGISSIMLAVVIFGIGTDYASFFICFHQRYLDELHPTYVTTRSAMLLTSIATIIGLGALCFARHKLLQGIGLTTSLAVAFSLFGTFFLLPPLLRKVLAERPFRAEPVTAGSPRHHRLVRERYARLTPYVRLFARFKLKFDPMFPRLADFVPPSGRLLDVGCGYGVQAAWLLTLRPGLSVVGLDPDPDRARVTRRVAGRRGEIFEGAAPNLPAASAPFDGVLLVDIIHYLTDEELTLTLRQIRSQLSPGGRLVIRATVPTAKRFTWERKLEIFRTRWHKRACIFRTPAEVMAMLDKTGFRLELSEPTRPGREETWFITSPAGRPEPKP
ncbi:MAG: methyltransferase domain-containing protein [bacterium]|nr:methyltransferase domain-containing protein [bacterium]